MNEQTSSFFRHPARKKLEQIHNFKQQLVLDEKRRNERSLFNSAKGNLIEASGLWKFRDSRMVLLPHEMQAFGSLTAIRGRIAHWCLLAFPPPNEMPCCVPGQSISDKKDAWGLESIWAPLIIYNTGPPQRALPGPLPGPPERIPTINRPKSTLFGSLSISFPEYPDSCRNRTAPALTFGHPQRHETATGPAELVREI